MLLDVFSLLLARYQSLMRNEKGKIKLQKKYIEEFMWGISVFWQLSLLPMSFFVPFFAYSLPFFYFDFKLKKKTFLLQKMVGSWQTPYPPSGHGPVNIGYRENDKFLKIFLSI